MVIGRWNLIAVEFGELEARAEWRNKKGNKLDYAKIILE